MPPADVRIQLPERYRVVRHVANGGMASVWAAEDSVLGRLVAVKVLAQHVAAEPSARTRFEREARTAARVSDHPNVVTIYDVGEFDDSPFIVMELFPGGSVGDRLRDGLSSIPRSRALTWLEHAANALDYAHAEGIVHRDIKPANLLLDDRDRLAVADFGIARAAEDSSLTQAGQVLGTAAYLSPEQALGRPATAASDRYSLGVVAFELLCGQRPFQGEHIAAQARQHVEGEVPDSGLGLEVDDVLQRAMAKAPDDRYVTATRFVDELRAVVTKAGAPATEVTRKAPATRAPAAVPIAEPTAAAAAPARPPARRREAVPPPPVSGTPAAAQRGDGSGRRGWMALAALAALALAIAAIALVAGNGGGDSGSSTTQRAKRSATSGRQSTGASSTPQAAATPDTPAQTQAATPSPTPQGQDQGNGGGEGESGPGPDSETNESPSTLNDRGFALIQQGKPQDAVAPLQQAVKGFEAQGDNADSTTYGYALYNLATALSRSDRPGDAIPYYERRLQVSPNDRPGLVRKDLKAAKKAAGQQ